MLRTIALVAVCAAITGCASNPPTQSAAKPVDTPTASSSLGAFSVSLAVKDLAASREFYRKLGFEPGHGDGKSWIVMRNGDTVIGLFQGMFPKNMLTFNPGWSQQAQPLASFSDVRELQEKLKASGLKLTNETDPAGSGPGYVMLADPDGNPILFDQHVPKPK